LQRPPDFWRLSVLRARNRSAYQSSTWTRSAKALLHRLNLLSRKPLYLSRPHQQRENAGANYRPLISINWTNAVLATRHGLTQVPNFILTKSDISVGAKLAYAKRCPWWKAQARQYRECCRDRLATRTLMVDWAAASAAPEAVKLRVPATETKARNQSISSSRARSRN
jgi:hypothetical protein